MTNQRQTGFWGRIRRTTETAYAFLEFSASFISENGDRWANVPHVDKNKKFYSRGLGKDSFCI